MKKFLLWLLAALITHTAAAAPSSVALYYGASPPWDLLRSFDLVVVDPDHVPTPRTLAVAPPDIAAYVAVGEVQPSRPYAAAIPRTWFQGKNPDWGSRLIDQSQAGWPDFFATHVIAPLWEAGYRSFFFDTLDSYHLFAKTAEHRAAQEAGLVALVREVKQRFPQARLVFNRGFEILAQTHTMVDMVAAESLYQGYDANKHRYRPVPEADRQWLLDQLRTARDRYGLPVLAIDYVPPQQRALARETARKIRELGIIPWVSTPNLASMGLGSVEAMPRKILVVHSVPANESALRNLPPVRLLSLPLNYLGYVPEFVDVRNLPAHSLPGRYAGIAIWQTGDETPAQQRTLSKWLQQQLTDAVPVAWFDMPATALDDGLRRAMGITLFPGTSTLRPISVALQSTMVGFERAPTPTPDSFMGMSADNSQPLLVLKQAARTQLAAAVTPWGGYVSPPFAISTLPGELGSRWIINPFDFLTAALRLPPMPVADTTTETGRRMLMVHMDGDGFISRAELPTAPLAGEVVRDRVVQNYHIPMTISVIEAEIAPGGLYPALSAQAEKVAQDIFKAPHVAIASHSYSHPFFWYKISTEEAGEGYNLRLPGYRFNLEREINGSIAYIEQRLAPPGKKVDVFLWTGDCIPTSKALGAVASAGVLNMNGGDTVATRANPTLTHMEGLGLQRPGGFQVFAPNQNENVYTNNWQEPPYGFERVLETFELTESPRRLKPIDIYFHTYLVTKRAGLQTLDRIFQYALRQPHTPVHIAEYARKVLDFQNLSIAHTPQGWQIRGAQNLRSLRVPATVRLPDLQVSQGIAGYQAEGRDRYVHLAAESAFWVDAEQPMATQPLLVSANGKVTAFQSDATRTRWNLSGHVPLQFTLKNVQGCEVHAGPRKILPVRQDGTLSHFELSDHVAQPLEALCRH